MDNYQHSVVLDPKKCTGCTLCVRHCPTEAIRIRNGRAEINSMRCIDCGECIRTCLHQAKRASSSKIEAMERFRWKIALPAPTVYGQFDGLEDIDYVLQGLLDIGFDEVYEVARAAELVSAYTRRYINLEVIPKPIISSACPSVIRLISLRFPSLVGNVLPLLPPMEIAAMEARQNAKSAHPELSDEDIGVCFISPCPAKVSYVTNGFGSYKSNIDEVVSIKSVYFKLIDVMRRNKTPNSLSKAGMIGISWAESGGESSAIFNEKYLAADGIDNVIRVLDKIETGSFPALEFIELNACPGGCVGGVMTVENPFIAKARLQTLRRYLPVSQNFLSDDDANAFIPNSFFFNDIPTYHPISKLSDNMGESMRMMSEIQSLRENLPGIDCGSCGAPTCRAFAEDVIKGNAVLSDCVIQFKAEIQDYIKNKADES